MGLLRRLQTWRRANSSAELATTAYAFACSCGQTLHGPRQATHQVVGCSQCRREHFVLPLSPLPLVAAPGMPPNLTTAPPAPQPAVPERSARPWLMPFAAGGVTFLLAAAGFWYLVDFLSPRGPSAAPTIQVNLEQQQELARKALLSGDYAEAVRHLEPLRGAQQGTPRQRRRSAQLERQAALLNDWPREPLAQVLGRTARLNDDEFQAVTGRHRGKAAVFDVVVRRDASRQYWVKPMGPGGLVTLNLDLQDVKLLSHLPLDGPQRLVFAGRIADLRRTGADSCTVRLDPDTAVLLTDVTAAGLGNLIADATLAPILTQQAQWVEELP